jgi:sortase A
MKSPGRSVVNTIIGVTGKTLVWAGLLLLGLVAYQLWGTGLETQRAQDRLEREFEEVLASANAVPPTNVGSPTDTGVTTGIAPPATAPKRPTKALALIRIPTAGVSDIVVDGVSASALRQGPGHVPETPLPGQPGNSAIAGHRSSYGAPFGDLDRVQKGDEVFITTLKGQYTYTVTRVEIVKPSRTDVMKTTSKKSTLTLITCHPRYSTDKRLIVHAKLTSSEAPVASSTTIVETTTPETVIPETTIPEATSPETTIPEPATPEAEIALAAIPIDEIDGWFSDTDAIFPTVLLGLLLVAVAVATYLARTALIKRGKRPVVARVITFGLAAAPFLVTLFFFYRFFNLLLPASS